MLEFLNERGTGGGSGQVKERSAGRHPKLPPPDHSQPARVCDFGVSLNCASNLYSLFFNFPCRGISRMVICVVAAENDDSAEVDKNAANESNQRRKVVDDIRITLAARPAFRPIYVLN
jgi:hypothetical protein